MEKLIGLGLFLAAVIHLLPLIGVTGSARLEQLYGISISDPNLLILMRHRALLFGALGGFLMLAAFQSNLQWPAISIGLISTIGFILIAKQSPELNQAISKVVMSDYIGIAALIIAALAKLRLQLT